MLLLVITLCCPSQRMGHGKKNPVVEIFEAITYWCENVLCFVFPKSSDWYTWRENTNHGRLAVGESVSVHWLCWVGRYRHRICNSEYCQNTIICNNIVIVAVYIYYLEIYIYQKITLIVFWKQKRWFVFSCCPYSGVGVVLF